MSKPTTGSLAITAWRNDDYFEYPLRVVGLDLSALALKMEIRASGDTPGSPLVRLDGVAQDQYVAQGLRVASVSVVDGVEVSDLRIRMDRGSLQELDYQGELGDAATFEYALLIGGRTRLTGPFILPAHAFGSDAAPAARPASYGIAQAASFPNGGATLTISADGGATVIIDGADLVSAAAQQVAADVAQAAADREAVEAISSTSYRAVETYGDREAIPLNKRDNGMRVQVMQAGQDANGYVPRVFEWRTDLFAPGGWTGLLTQAELQRRELQTGKQNQDTINGLPEALSGLDQVTQNVLAGVKRNATLAISTFAALAASTAGPVDLSWAIGGVTPRAQSLSWGGWSIDLDGYARALTLGPWTDRAIIVAGDSTADWLTAAGTWPQKAAATIGQTATPIALYSAGSKQVYRSGAKPLLLTLTGNRLSAGGTSVAVTAINGAAPGAANAASPLFTYAGDTRALTITGTIAGRHVTMSATGGGSAYSLTADAGSTATDVPAGSLFVPDFAQRMSRDELWIMVSHNHFYSGVTADHINLIALADVDALVRQARGQRICIMGLLADAAWVSGTPQYDAVRAYNAELKRRYPRYYVEDAQGRDPLARMIASGNGSANDNADAAAGIVPRSLRSDSLHPNDAGNAVLAALMVEFRTRQAQPPAIVVGQTRFTLTAEGDDGVGGSTQANAVTATTTSSPVGAERIVETATVKVMTGAERTALAISSRPRGQIDTGSVNDLTTAGTYTIGSGVADLPAGLSSGLLVVDNYGDFCRQTITSVTSSQLVTQYQRIVRASVGSYPGWVTISGAIGDGSVVRGKLAPNFSLNGGVSTGSANALTATGVFIVQSGVTDLPAGLTSGLLEVASYGDFIKQTIYSTTSSQVQTKYERVCRLSTSSYPGWTQVNIVGRSNLVSTFASNGTVNTGSFNDYFAEGTYVIGAALANAPTDADTPTTGLLDVRSWGGTFVVQRYVGTTPSAVLTSWSRIIRPGTSHGAWQRSSPAVAAKSRWAGRSVAFIGDSITRLVSATWPVDVTAALGLAAGYQAGMSGCTMGRRQFAGDQYNDYLRELGFTRLVDAMVSGDWSAPRAAAQYLSDNGQDAKILEGVNILAGINYSTLSGMLVGFGTNDFGCNLPIGVDGDADWTTFKGAINYGVTKLLTKYPTLRLLMWAPLWRGRQSPGDGKETDANPNSAGTFLTEYVDATIGRGRALKIPVLDMYRESGIANYNVGTMLSDGLHPYTAAGNERMKDKNAAFLDRSY